VRPRYKFGLLLAAIGCGVAVAALQPSVEEPPMTGPPMTFQLVKVSPLYDAVYAQGTITTDTGTAFTDFLKANPVKPGTTLYFDSPGGDVASGIELGQAIRKAGLDTAVAIPAAGTIVTQPAMCASACTLAFLGGVERTVAAKSRFGVHRFEFDNSIKNVAKKTQKVAGILVDYIGDMGASQEMFAYAMRDGNDAKNAKHQILWLDTDTMAKLKITTAENIKAVIVDGKGTPTLRVRDIDGAYEFGEIDFYCSGKALVARAYFAKPGATYDPGTQLDVSWSVSSAAASATNLAVPSGQYHVVSPSSGDQQLTVDIDVTPQTLNLLLPAKSVSLRITGPSGYNGVDVIGAASALPAKVQSLLKIISVCTA
jgi:hypothetical protein